MDCGTKTFNFVLTLLQSVQLGLCVPDSCSSTDIDLLITLGEFILYWTHILHFGESAEPFSISSVGNIYLFSVTGLFYEIFVLPFVFSKSFFVCN